MYGTTQEELDDCKNGETFSALIVGSHTKDGQSYYRLRNAWGWEWGLDGTFKLIYGENACGIRTTTAYPVPYSK